MTSHLAVDAQGNPYTAPGFDHVAHDRWVRDGFCPVVSASKGYCGKRPGHSGLHGSAIRKPVAGGFDDVTWIEWNR